MTKPPSTDEIRANLAEGRRLDYLIERAADGSITKLESKGKADHDRMMAAVEMIGYVGAREAQPTAPPCKPMDMEEGIAMWALTLPETMPADRKDKKARVGNVDAFYRWIVMEGFLKPKA